MSDWVEKLEVQSWLPPEPGTQDALSSTLLVSDTQKELFSFVEQAIDIEESKKRCLWPAFAQERYLVNLKNKVNLFQFLATVDPQEHKKVQQLAELLPCLTYLEFRGVLDSVCVDSV